MKKILAFLLIVMLIFSSNLVALAETINFIDVSKNHWAVKDIEFASEKGIVNGYYTPWTDTYTFAPENSVSYEEAATMLYRAFIAAGEIRESAKLEEFSDSTGELLAANNIADWAKVYVGYFVEKDIISEEELSAFVDDKGMGNPAPRMTVAVWIAKTLNKDILAVRYLPYGDLSSISDENAGYVDMLYRYGIMKGSLNENGSVTFNGNNGVKRSEFAAIANRVYNVLNNDADIEKTVVSYSGDELSYLRYDENSEIFLDGKVCNKAAKEAAKSAKVVATLVVPEGKTSQIHMYKYPLVIEGSVTSIEKLSNNIKRVCIDSDESDVYYIIDENTENVVNLKTGKNISCIVDGVRIIEIRLPQSHWL